MRKNSKYKKFESLLDRILAVPYNAVRAKLDAEKEARKKRKLNASSSVRDSNNLR
jgi:hypothetical protein